MTDIIINADDFGYSRLFNKRILELIAEGKITSTSVMVDHIDEAQKPQAAALKVFFGRGVVSVGLHVDFQNTDFDSEIRRQFEKFNAVFGFAPTHIDIHKSTYLQDGYAAIQNFAKAKGIPCKNLSEYGKIMGVPGALTTAAPIFSGTGKSIEEIKTYLSHPAEKLLFLNFHPGYYDPESRSGLNKERELDAQKIIAVSEFIKGKDFKLVSFTAENFKDA